MTEPDSAFVKYLNEVYSQIWRCIEDSLIKPLISWVEGFVNWYIFTYLLPHVEVREAC
jgi:hypothetical protein